MYFANPWGLLGLIALPVIAVIHLYHRRFPQLMVAGAHLWGVEAQVRTAGRKIERLPITATLLLELLAALLLSLILSEPRIGDLTKATHLVVVLDNSASMMGTPAEEEDSFRDLAIAELKSRAENLKRGSVVTLILTGRRPVMLAGPAIAWEEAEKQLSNWQPAQTRHEFQSAWDLAAQMADESGELLFLTDVVPDEKNPVPNSMEVISAGQRLDNVAITTARWTFDSETATGKVFLRISNLGQSSAEITIQGTSGNATVFQKKASIPRGRSAPLETAVAGGLGVLNIEIKSPLDGLELDNRVTLIEPKVRMLTIAETLPVENDAKRFVNRVLQATPDWQSGSPADAHLVIGSASVLPPSQRDLWWMGIGPIDSPKEARDKSKHLVGPFLLEKRNAILDGVVLGGVVWSGAQSVDLSVTPLISVGRIPLLSRLNGTKTMAYLLNIDMGESNLADSPDWPILLNNVIELRRNELPGLQRWNYRLDESVQFRLPNTGDSDTSPEKELILEHDGTSKALARLSTVEVGQLEDTGVYTLKDGEQVIGQFAVNFHDVDESTLTDLRPGVREPIVPTQAAGITLDNPYSWLIMLGIVLILAVAFLDWYVLRPRVV